MVRLSAVFLVVKSIAIPVAQAMITAGNASMFGVGYTIPHTKTALPWHRHHTPSHQETNPAQPPTLLPRTNSHASHTDQ